MPGQRAGEARDGWNRNQRDCQLIDTLDRRLFTGIVSPPATLSPARVRAAKAALGAEPRFAELIGRVGSFRLKPSSDREPFQALFRAIVFQAVSTAAARTIYERVVALVGGPADSAALLGTGREALRSAGLSYAKADALHDLARKTRAGLVPNAADVVALSDEELIARLTQIRGIGRWTVEMLLIFGLGRTDVLPVDDLAIRRGYRLAFHKRREPARKELQRIGEAWAPHRSVAAWYLWRATELDW